jgi:hypothetical protein
MNGPFGRLECRQYVSAVRFFFFFCVKPMRRYFLAEFIPFSKMAPQRLPTLLGSEEATRLIDASHNLISARSR